MVNEFQGDSSAGDGRYGIVVARYNSSITEKLLSGAIQALRAAGVPETNIDVARVPGAFEIPLVAQRLAEGNLYDAVLCLGAVVRGETTHDQHINRAVSLGITEIALHSGIPVLLGVLTCDTLEQAIHRAGGRAGNKGVECAEAALEMVALLKTIPSE